LSHQNILPYAPARLHCQRRRGRVQGYSAAAGKVL
jgi:hypothetical protein